MTKSAAEESTRQSPKPHGRHGTLVYIAELGSFPAQSSIIYVQRNCTIKQTTTQYSGMFDNKICVYFFSGVALQKPPRYLLIRKHVHQLTNWAFNEWERKRMKVNSLFQHLLCQKSPCDVNFCIWQLGCSCASFEQQYREKERKRERERRHPCNSSGQHL